MLINDSIASRVESPTRSKCVPWRVGLDRCNIDGRFSWLSAVFGLYTWGYTTVSIELFLQQNYSPRGCLEAVRLACLIAMGLEWRKQVLYCVLAPGL
jgi:hypothetical protein